jgi:hypothetical protein
MPRVGTMIAPLWMLLWFGSVCNADLGYQLTASGPIVMSEFLGVNYPSEIYDPSMYDAAILTMQSLSMNKVRIPIAWAALVLISHANEVDYFRNPLKM